MKSEILDVDDFETESRKIDQKSNKIRNLLIQLGFDYTNKITGQLKNEQFYQCRDNLTYRINSCIFLNSKSWEIRVDYENQNFDPIFMGSAQYPILWVTDSLIFNLSSLFDYIAGFLELIVGKEGKNQMQWNSIHNSFLTKEPHKSSLFAEKVNEMHLDFVNKLISFRSTVIHYKVQAGGVNYSHELGTNIDKKTLHLFCSNGFLKNFKNLKKEYPDTSITLQYANFWLLNKSLDYLIELINISFEHLELNRKIPKGKEIITRKSG